MSKVDDMDMSRLSKVDTRATIMKIQYVDGNGLALASFGFTTWMFAAFLCNWVDVGDPTSDHFGLGYIIETLTWGTSLTLVVAGLVQGFNDDKLGFTSYLFHAALLGTIGYNFEQAMNQGDMNSQKIVGFFCYAAFFVNLIFTFMGYQIAKMFGLLYLFVALTFLFVGLNFQGILGAEHGGTVAGSFCCITSMMCFYLMVPVLTGKALLR